MKAAEEVTKLQEHRDSGIAVRRKQVSIAAVVGSEKLLSAEIPNYLQFAGRLSAQ